MARTINPLDNQEVELEENEELVSLSEEVEKPTEEPEQKANETEKEEAETSEIPISTKINRWKMLFVCTKKLKSYWVNRVQK